MTSKSWPNEFGRACAIISLLCCWPVAAGAQTKPPGVALLDPGEAPQWRQWTRDAGWQVIVASDAAQPDIDSRVRALATAVEAAIQGGSVDPRRVYIAGRGDAGGAVFYAISRVPDLWAAGAAIGGSPKAALDTNRIFAANFRNVPVLWIAGEDAKPMAEKLTAAELRVELQPATGNVDAAAVMQWLARHSRDAFPAAIDCETNAPAFSRCYWIQPTKFDAGERNDVLPLTRIPGGSGARLDLGAFGFNADDPGPGLLVTSLPEKYSGPLKNGDRLVALDGKPLASARQYLQLMEKVTEERQAVVGVQRGKERVRVETRVVLPRRDSGVTSRVQAQYLPAEKEIQIISRTITEMRVTVASEWIPARLVWNGLMLENLQEGGCWVLSVQRELLRAERCK